MSIQLIDYNIIFDEFGKVSGLKINQGNFFFYGWGRRKVDLKFTCLGIMFKKSKF